jgi:tellurite resistance protein
MTGPTTRILTARSPLSLAFLPVNLFGAVMGISGLALAWQHAHQVFGMPEGIAEGIGMLAMVMFIAIALGYALKALHHPRKVVDEFMHPIAGNFFGTITISILLLSSIVLRYSQATGQAVWSVGVVLTIALSWVALSRLLTTKQDLTHATPPWIIPGVATLDIAVAGGTMPFPWAHEVNLFSVAIGGVLALAMFVMIVSRLIHHDPLPLPMTPSLMILIAPFEVGFLAYVNMTQQIDMLAALLFYFGLFLFAVLFFKVFHPSVSFSPAWWAVSFPMAALSNAALKYAMHVGTWPLKLLAAALLLLLTVVLATLFAKTLAWLFSGRLLRAS